MCVQWKMCFRHKQKTDNKRMKISIKRIYEEIVCHKILHRKREFELAQHTERYFVNPCALSMPLLRVSKSHKIWVFEYNWKSTQGAYLNLEWRR